MTSIYVKIGSYLLAAILGFWLGWTLGADRWEAKYNGLQAEDWKGKADRLQVQNTALTNDLAKALVTARTNAEIIDGLNKQATTLAASRDALAGQLQWVFAHPPRPGSGGLPQGGGQPGTPAASTGSGPPAVAGLLADAITECRGNNLRHNALEAQLRPQL